MSLRLYYRRTGAFATDSDGYNERYCDAYGGGGSGGGSAAVKPSEGELVNFGGEGGQLVLDGEDCAIGAGDRTTKR